MVVIHENEKFKYIPKHLENMKIKYGTGIKGGNSIYLPRKTFYGQTLPITFESAIVKSMKSNDESSIQNSVKNILTPKKEEGKGLQIIENISKEAADRILKKGKGFHFENI